MIRKTRAKDKILSEQFITNKLLLILKKFQEMEIKVTSSGFEETMTVHVHIPYMLQTIGVIENPIAFSKLANRQQERLLRVKANRENAPESTKRFLRNRFFKGDTEQPIACGRAHVNDIRKLLQKAVDKELIRASGNKPYPDGHDLRTWLKFYGIGIDCSAFVQHVLTKLVKACYKTTGINTNYYQDYKVGWLRTANTYTKLNASPTRCKRFDKIDFPGEAQPGDILVRKGHIRLVVRAVESEGGSTMLELAESTSVCDIPKGATLKETDIGPRLIRVLYPKPKLPIREQSPFQMGLKEHNTPSSDESSYILGRLKKLNQL